MEFLVISVKTAILGSEQKVIEIAAVVLDREYREIAAFEALVNPGGKAIEALGLEALETHGISKEDLVGGLELEEAAKDLRTLLEAHPLATVHAYNRERAQKLLGVKPWSMQPSAWGACVLEEITDLMESEGVFDGSHGKRPKMSEAAAYLKVLMPVKRRALPDARVSAIILSKMLESSRKMSDTDFLIEARNIMEDGL